MGQAAAGVLLLDVGDALAEVPRLLEKHGVVSQRVEYVPGSDAGLWRLRPAVVAIGPGVANPAAAARRVSSVHSGVRIVFVAEAGREEAVRRTLLFSAPANTPWKLVESNPRQVAEAVVAAIDLSRRAAHVRTTLDRFNLRLASAAPPDPQDYRRLVVSDQYLASVLKHVQDAIISVDLQGRILSWNDGATRLFGVGPREAIGQSLATLAVCSADLGELVQAAVSEGFVRTELRFRVRAAELLIDATFSSIEERRSEVLAVAVILRDITERKRTEEALAANEARFRALADNIPQLAWMTDERGWVFWYNQRWFDFTGTTLEQMQGFGWRQVHHPDHVERVVAKFQAHIEAQVAWEDSFPLRAANGEYRWFLSRATPIRNAAGRVTLWFGTNTDITAEKASQEALLEADRRKNEFISVLSHELRNPLAPIRSSIYLLEHMGADEAVAEKARAVIRRQTEHLTRLVDDLLDVTRIARGRIELMRARADVCAVVRGTVEDYRPVVEGAGLRLHVDAPDCPVYGEIDGARIGQVIGNLLQNAVKFTPSGGRIEVSMKHEGSFMRIAVRDTGLGIEPALLRELFAPFVQGERSLERSQGGLGLGLALARGIVEMHGGRLEAESEGVDLGATFTVWLPAVRQPAGAAEAAPSGDAVHSGEGRQVLIVDDNRDAADSLAQLVKLFGHEAQVAYDGPSALVCARERKPDVVLCDIGLPGMDGYEVARRLREELDDPVRLVAVSGYAQEADRRQAAEAGFEGHLAKPPKPEEVRRWLQ